MRPTSELFLFEPRGPFILRLQAMKPHLLLALVIVSLLVVLPSQAETSCSHALNGKIIDNPLLTSLLSNVRDGFMQSRPHPFSRCDITVLLPQKDGTYHRASYNQNEVGYPASTVKLTYLVSAIEWCKRNSKNYDCLDSHVRPMIYTSDNFETGVIVDYITGTTNYHPSNMNASDPVFQNWWKKRNFTEEYFDSRGLLEKQVIISKTYPSNSGAMPSGAEALLREVVGQNMMNPKCAASLMAEISGGYLHPNERDYMLGMLQHSRTSGDTSFAQGVPPGSILHNKIGNAYDTIEEIAYITLPDGYSFILAVYTNGYEPSEPHLDTLSPLVEMIIDSFGLGKTLPPKYIFTASDLRVSGNGWSMHSSQPDKYGSSYWYNTGVQGASASWNINLPQSGMYEVSIWNPENSAWASVPYTVVHAYGTDSSSINERVNGGRWVRFGDFNFLSNQPAIISVASPGKPFVVNALKLTLWPSCGSIPGTFCTVK